MPSIEQNNDAFAAACREMYKQPEIAAARKAVMNAEKLLKASYRKLALNHWRTRGKDASTGYGYTPEGQYQSSRDPRSCATTLAEQLWESFSCNPSDPPGWE